MAEMQFPQKLHRKRKHTFYAECNFL